MHPQQKSGSCKHHTRQAFISELHWCSLLQLLLPQNMLEQVVLSNLGPSILSWSIVDAWEWLGDSSRVSTSRGSNDGHGPSLQVHKGIAIDGNGLQVTGQSISDGTEATRFLPMSGVREMDGWSRSRGCSMQGVHRPKDMCNLFSFAWEPGNLTKEITPCLQRGQGIEPGGPTISEETLFVEQR